MFKKKYLLFFSLLILGVLFITSCLPKPPVTEGILKGQVIVPEGSAQAKQLTGQALSDATVNIIDLSTGEVIAITTTDLSGYYQVFVPAGGPYLLEAIKDGVKVLQITPQVEAGIEYDLGTADCRTTAVALIAQAMMDAEDYPDDPADINLADIEADPNFNDVMSVVCSAIEAGGDPAESALVQQAVEDFLHPPTPTPTPSPTPPPLSDAKAITAFDFAALDPDVVGVINEAAKTIALTVPFGTDVTALVPTIVHTGASVSPASGAAQDFTSPVNYTVTAEDGSTQAYVVTVTVALSDAKAITAFDFAALDPDVVGVINEAAKTIALTVPFGTDVTALVPTIVHTGASVSPASGAAQDFTSPVNYTVTAEDGSTQAYVVTVTPLTYTVGDTGPAGGWIFYDKESYSDGWRYLEAAPNDQTSRSWGTSRLDVQGADGTAIGDGKQNTLDIIIGDPLANKAADECDSYSITNGGVTYDDWFLPSKDELNQMYANLHSQGVGGFTSDDYWSSSEKNKIKAWKQDFNNGNQNNNGKNNTCRVRAVRAF